MFLYSRFLIFHFLTIDFQTKSQRTLNLGLVFCYKAYHLGLFASRIMQAILAFFCKKCGIVHILPLVALYYKKTARNKLRLFGINGQTGDMFWKMNFDSWVLSNLGRRAVEPALLIYHLTWTNFRSWDAQTGPDAHWRAGSRIFLGFECFGFCNQHS